MDIADKKYNITTNGLTVLAVNKTSSSTNKFLLIRIVINKKGASSNVAEIYDSTETLGKDSDYAIGILDTTAQVGAIDYGLIINNGIYIDVNTGTAPNLTVIYKEIS